MKAPEIRKSEYNMQRIYPSQLDTLSKKYYLCTSFRQGHSPPNQARPTERWQSGRMWRSRNPLYRKVPGVRIPLSPQRGFKVTAKWSSEKPSKQEEIVVGHGLTTIFLCMQSIDLTAYP